MWTRSYTASWGDVYTHFLFWASFFLEYFFENPAQKRINLAFLSTFLSKFIPFEQFIPFLSTFLSTFLSNIQQKYFFEHFFEYSKKYSKCWVLFWVLFWELFWGFFWDFHYDKTYLCILDKQQKKTSQELRELPYTSVLESQVLMSVLSIVFFSKMSCLKSWNGRICKEFGSCTQATSNLLVGILRLSNWFCAQCCLDHSEWWLVDESVW